MRYEFLKHTADVAVRAYGSSLEDLFESAAIAMFGVMLEKIQNNPGSKPAEKEIAVSGRSYEDLLKAWLDELLFAFSADQQVLVRVKSKKMDEENFRAKVLFETFDRQYYSVKDEIKAVTYHELEVKKAHRQWQAQIIFDV